MSRGLYIGQIPKIQRQIVTRCTSTDVLDLCQLWILDDLAGRVARVRRQDDRGSASDLFGDLFGMDMVAIGL